MEYSFPPPPPGYVYTLIARVILVVWSLIGLGILVFRIWHWKSIRAKESWRWAVAAILSCLAAMFGKSHRYVFDDNMWLTPIFFAALAVPTAGVFACWAKLSMEQAAKRTMEHAGGAMTVVCLIWTFIGFSVFMSLHSLSHPPEAHYRTTCKNNLKQIGLALHNYHDETRSFPPAKHGTPASSWRIAILPFLDQRETYRRYQQSSDWNSSANLPLAQKKLPEFICPSNGDPQDARGLWYSAYSMPTGPHSVGADAQGTKLGQITDGSSNTFLVVEACGAQIVWSEPRDVNIQTQPSGINLKGTSPGQSAGWLSSYHSHGAFSLLADGAVRFISDRADTGLLRQLATIDGGEKINREY